MKVGGLVQTRSLGGRYLTAMVVYIIQRKSASSIFLHQLASELSHFRPQ